MAQPDPDPRGATPTATPLPKTPAVDALLDQVGRRLTACVWMHGLGTVAIAVSLWLAFAFTADWSLHLPAPVRVVHLLVLVGLPAWLLVRDLVRPLSRRPDRAGLALLVERAHPQLRELLVSAVQLSAAREPDGERALVARVLADADRAAAGLSPERVLDVRGPRRRALWGALAATTACGLLAWNAGAAGVFLARLSGAGPAWPQRTHLVLEVPLAQENAPSSARTGELMVRVARGSDVPVVVHAEGEVPDEVVLHVAGGNRAVLGASGGASFRTVLRSVQEDLVLFATGGDDEDEDPRVRLVVLQPPDVTGVAVRIRPPAYSGLPERLEVDRDVEVLAGSELTVHVRTSPPEVTGRARLLPEDRVLDLAPAPFPAPEPAPGEAAAPAGPGLAFQLTAERSVRYRFEITDAQGLSNPDPGLFGVTVVADRAPEVEITAPGRGDFDTVPGGLLPLRARAQDDFALAQVGYEVTPPGAEAGSGELRPLEWRLLTDAERAAEAESSRGEAVRAGPRAQALAHARLEVDALTVPGAPPEGQQLQLVVRALDNAEPAAHEGRSGPLRVRVVAPEEFLRRIQDRLARAQAAAAQLLELQRDKRRRTLDVLATVSSDAPGLEGAQAEVAAALTGQRRVEGDARSLARELAAAAEAVLYARVDDRAAAALAQLERAQAESVTRGFDPEPWRELARAPGLDTGGLAGKLVDIAALAVRISEDQASLAVRDLAAAQDAIGIPGVQQHLTAAEAAQAAVQADVEKLLERLAEWDNFQSVLGLTRDILNGQKSLSERTRQTAKER